MSPRPAAVHVDLVVFDCDGVLVDSERITNGIFCAMLNELGLALTLEDMFERFVGHSMAQCIETVTAMLGRAPPDTFVPELNRRTARALRDGVRAMPGIEAALDAIEFPCCVASSGGHDKIRLTLGTAGLLARFEGRIFSAADVECPKPAPDVFMLAASVQGADPARCVVVEDTPVGVQAGVAAGMRVLGFAADTPAQRLRAAGAHAVFAHMAALPELVRGLY